MAFGLIAASAVCTRLRHFCTVVGLIPWRRVSAPTLSSLRCIARRNASVVMTLPCELGSSLLPPCVSVTRTTTQRGANTKVGSAPLPCDRLQRHSVRYLRPIAMLACHAPGQSAMCGLDIQM